MGPLSRLVAAVVLAALSAAPASAHGGHGRGQHVHVLPAGSPGSDVTVDGGICSGSARVAPSPVLSGPALDLRKTPIPKEFRGVWTSAGYRIDDAAARLTSADGRPVPGGEYRRLLEPFDAAAERIEAMQWVTLMTQGIRLDEATCFLLEGDRKVTRLEIAAMKPDEKRSLELMEISSLRAALRGLPPDGQIPPAGKVLAATDGAYASLPRYFDGQRDAESLVRSALPVIPGYNEPPKPRALVGAVEERRAAALSEDLAARFATREAGREMLERFRGKDGQVHLPVVRVLNLSQRPDDPGYGMAAAVQDPSNGTVVPNHWVVARLAVAAAPAKKRAGTNDAALQARVRAAIEKSVVSAADKYFIINTLENDARGHGGDLAKEEEYMMARLRRQQPGSEIVVVRASSNEEIRGRLAASVGPRDRVSGLLIMSHGEGPQSGDVRVRTENRSFSVSLTKKESVGNVFGPLLGRFAPGARIVFEGCSLLELPDPDERFVAKIMEAVADNFGLKDGSIYMNETAGADVTRAREKKATTAS